MLRPTAFWGACDDFSPQSLIEPVTMPLSRMYEPSVYTLEIANVEEIEFGVRFRDNVALLAAEYAGPGSGHSHLGLGRRRRRQPLQPDGALQNLGWCHREDGCWRRNRRARSGWLRRFDHHQVDHH